MRVLIKGFVDRDQYKSFKEKGKPDIYCKSVGGQIIMPFKRPNWKDAREKQPKIGQNVILVYDARNISYNRHEYVIAVFCVLDKEKGKRK